MGQNLSISLLVLGEDEFESCCAKDAQDVADFELLQPCSMSVQTSKP